MRVTIIQYSTNSTFITSKQARRQDRVTGGGAGINFGGAREVSLCEFERGTGSREIYSSVDQPKKVKTKKKVFGSKISTNSGCHLKILAIFHEFLSEDQKKGLRPKSFIKSGVNPQKITKIRAVNTNLECQASICTPKAPSLLISSGHSPRLGGRIFVWGAQALIWGGTAPECPPLRRACVKDFFVLSIIVLLVFSNNFSL